VLMTLLCVIPATFLWQDTRWLMVTCLIFCAAYVALYRHMSSWTDRK
jgi:hypothetical protein